MVATALTGSHTHASASDTYRSLWLTCSGSLTYCSTVEKHPNLPGAMVGYSARLCGYMPAGSYSDGKWKMENGKWFICEPGTTKAALTSFVLRDTRNCTQGHRKLHAGTAKTESDNSHVDVTLDFELH